MAKQRFYLVLDVDTTDEEPDLLTQDDVAYIMASRTPGGRPCEWTAYERLDDLHADIEDGHLAVPKEGK